MFVCKCLICNYIWKYKDTADENIIRASSSPCGHQGLFTVTKEEEMYRKEKEKEEKESIDGT